MIMWLDLTCHSQFTMAAPWHLFFTVRLVCNFLWLSKDHGKKWKFSCKNMSKFKIFWYMRVIYIKRKLRTCTIQIQKEKVWFFPKKKFFLIFSIFFPKGGPFYVEIVKNFFSVFQKFWKQNPKMTFMGPFKHKQKQSHEFWWS